MKTNRQTLLSAIAVSAVIFLQISPAAAQTPSPGPSTCTLKAPATARPSSNIQLEWTATNQPTSASAQVDGKVIAANEPLEPGSLRLAAPEGYGTHFFTLAVENAQGRSTCKAEVFVAAQTTVAAPPNTFTWAYSSNEDGFTDDEIRYLAENYTYIVLTRQHARFSIDRRHIDAQKIKAVNPKAKLFSYYSMTARFHRESVGDSQHPPVFNRAWLLRDPERQEPVAFTYRGRPNGDLIDLANPDYRAWLQATLRDWLRKAPYDGIAFDNSIPIADAKHRIRELRGVKLSPETISRYNEALAAILSDNKHLRGERNEVIFNGIAPTASRLDRSLYLLKYADMALNEQFCVAPRDGKFLTRERLKQDIELMTGGAKIQQLVKYRRPIEGLSPDQAARFCYGVFMMGYQPSANFFQFRDDGRQRPDDRKYETRLYGNAAEVKVDLGEPTSAYADGEVWTRKFRQGVVHVNPDDAPHTVTIDRDGILMNGNKAGEKFTAGSSVTVPPRDALFVAYEVPAGAPAATATRH